GENAAVSVGAALATNDIANTLRTAIEGAGSAVTAGSVELLAESSSHITVRTTGGANADTFALGGSVSLNKIGNIVAAQITDGAEIDADGLVQLTARDASVLDAQAGGTGENAAASVGAGLGTHDIANTRRTGTEGAGSAVAAGSVELLAESSSTITVRTTGGANADTFALGGSVSLNQ